MSVTFLLAMVALAAAAVFIAIAFLRHRDPERRATAVKRLGFVEMAVFAVLAGIFIGAEAFDDAGGTQAAWLVLAWLRGPVRGGVCFRSHCGTRGAGSETNRGAGLAAARC
jgi:hypothetical protein